MADSELELTETIPTSDYETENIWAIASTHDSVSGVIEATLKLDCDEQSKVKIAVLSALMALGLNGRL